AELTFQVLEGQPPPPLRFTMSPLHSPADIHSDPEAAAVFLDNRPVGVTPLAGLALNPGPHQIRLERRGFLTTVKKVDARPGVKLVVSARLDPAPPNLASTPPSPPPV